MAVTQLLIRRFVPHWEQTGQPAVRAAYGRLAGIVGIVLNLLLAVGKLLAGAFTGSISVTADAFNSLSDAGSSIVTLLGFHLAGKKPDAEHPFGHGRMEYLSGLLVSALVLLVGFELLRSSLGKILHPVSVSFSLLSAVILAVSALVKLWMSHFNRKLGRRIRSAAMEATAADSLSDAAATTAVLAGLLAEHFFHVTIDGWVGLLVSFFVLKAGWGAVRETLDPLLGRPADPELVHAIYTTVMAHEGILGIHDLIIHDYGPGRRMMSFHAEVPADGDMMAAHDLIDNTERELKQQYGIETVIHMDPVKQDGQTQLLREQVAQLAAEVDPGLTIHDFRITAGPSHTNLIFDVVVPNGFSLSDAALLSALREKISSMDGGTYYAVVQIDHTY